MSDWTKTGLAMMLGALVGLCILGLALKVLVPSDTVSDWRVEASDVMPTNP